MVKSYSYCKKLVMVKSYSYGKKDSYGKKNYS